MAWISKIFFLFLCFWAPALYAGPQGQATNPWRITDKPTKAFAEAIGQYAAGCLHGAQRLALREPGLELMRPNRRRYYGHPDLIAFLRHLGKFAQNRTFGSVLIGDLAQARGGPTLSQHQSHQSGLDADIWLWLYPPKKKILEMERETLDAPSMVDWEKKQLSAHWQPKVAELLRFTAKQANVERILINPVIKKHLCENAKGDKTWLKKLRPWWGHADHMHVRLGCPKSSPNCTGQDPVLDDIDCGKNLDWWFTPEAHEEFLKLQAKIEKAEMPVLPDRCAEVLRSP